MGKLLTEIEAAIRVKMSPRLLRWFTANAPKHGSKRKLPFTEKGGEYFYDVDHLEDFDKFLHEPWPVSPKQTRPTLPVGIKQEIFIEAHHKCAFCEYVTHGEGAHIEAVAASKCNHPHNLIWSCANHHTEYDHGFRLASQLSKDHVKLIKRMLLDTQMRHWRIELWAVSSVLSLVNEVEAILEYLRDPKLQAFKSSLEAQAKSILEATNATAKTTTPAGGRGKASPSYGKYLKDIARITRTTPQVPAATVEDVLKNVSDATAKYLEEDALSKCPLCKGDGQHNGYRCPVCLGEGTVETKQLITIDLGPYEQVDCPLCGGGGEHNRHRCPVCAGVGTVDKAAVPTIDLRPYEQEDCPLCEGSGVHNRQECPFCFGVKTVDARAQDFFDPRDYRQEECPICEGSGKRGFRTCPVCNGVGSVDAAIVNNIDYRDFETRACPLCDGSRRHRGDTCPVCEGAGEVDRAVADIVDLSQFAAVTCPLCDGEKEYRDARCPLCHGDGDVDRRVADEVDLNVFED